VIESADTQAAKRGGLVSRPLGFTAFIAQLHERRQPELELLPFVRLDHFLDLLFYGVEVKGSRRLHRRIVYGGLRELKDAFLHHDETPEFASVSHSCNPPAEVVQAFASDRRSAFEGVLPNVHDRWHVGGDLFTRPAPWLLNELKFEVIDANSAEMRAAEVEEFVVRRGASALSRAIWL
jgi:hypothetical protein